MESENNFHSSIFKCECRLTKHDLIPKHKLLRRHFTPKFLDNLYGTCFPILFKPKAAILLEKKIYWKLLESFKTSLKLY